ncbi:MAG: hypothetical protein U1E60_22900 [Reyranellaceae bacterium]
MRPLAVLALLTVTGCTQYCGATPDKLAALRRGMSYQETAAIMGCPGDMASATPPPGEMSAILWNGPDSILFSRTQLEFFDDRLLWYTIISKGNY